MFRMNIQEYKSMSPPENVITSMNKAEFGESLKNNTGAVIIKFGAEWCGPCKQIESQVYTLMAQMPTEIMCAVLDIDDEASFDLYAFLKSKRMVNGVPALLCYKKGNMSWVPDDTVVGANAAAIQALFQKCLDVYAKA
jgi:thioredoxin 1